MQVMIDVEDEKQNQTCKQVCIFLKYETRRTRTKAIRDKAHSILSEQIEKSCVLSITD